MIIFRASFAFARRVKQLKAPQLVKEKVEEENEQKEDEVEKQVFEKKFIKTQEYLMACNHQPAIKLPEEILKRVRKVFSKYPPDELRETSYKYMRMYQLLHALEKPQAITIKRNNLFENPENLQKLTDKNIIHLNKTGTNEYELWRNIQERRKRKDASTDRISSAEQKLDDFHAFQSAIDYDQTLTVSYLLRKVPGSYAVAYKLMSEILKRNPSFSPKTMLDFGSGVGTWAWAFKNFFPDVKNIVGVEPNIFMRKLGKFVTNEYIKDMKFYESLSHTLELDYDQFDFISIAFVLEEINQPEARLLTLQSLWAKLSNEGIMILACPGSPTGFRFVNDFREWVLKQQGNILAPCPHQQSCPMAKEGFQWCHFKQMFATWPKDVFPKYIYENTTVTEKFSYIAVSKQQFVQEGEGWPRLVFDPLKRGKHLIMDMCTETGALERRVIGKSLGKEGGYFESKHLHGGDLWRFPKQAPKKVGKKRTRKLTTIV